jgi:hypothetical protein
MRVLVPATPDGLHQSIVPAILRQGWACQVEPMVGVEAYYHLLVKLWAAADDFALVEHDTEPPPGALDGFDDCPELWCAHSYEVYSGDIAAAYGGPFGLGLSRFRGELCRMVPDAVITAGTYNDHPVHPPRSYAVMDSTLTKVLRGFAPDIASGVRLQVHQHFPNATHHHRYVRANTFPAFTPPAPQG